MASRAPLWFTASVDSLATEEEPVVKTLATVELDAAVPDRVLDIVAAISGLTVRRARASLLRVDDESYPLLVFLAARELLPTPMRWRRLLPSSRVRIA